MKISVCNQLREHGGNLKANNREIILKITCNKTVSLLQNLQCIVFKWLKYRQLNILCFLNLFETNPQVESQSPAYFADANQYIYL